MQLQKLQKAWLKQLLRCFEFENACLTKQGRMCRFSLKTLFVFLTLMAIAFTCVCSRYRSCDQQASDIRFLQEHSFEVVGYTRPTLLDQQLLGLFPFEGVLSPTQGRGVVDEQCLEILARHSTWRELDLSVCANMESRLNQALQRWPELEELSLRGDLGSSAIPSLRFHKNLSLLDLELSECDSEFITAIATAPALRTLRINTQLSDKDIALLLDRCALTSLSIVNCDAISSVPFMETRHPTIQYLSVMGSRIDSRGLKCVLAWPAIRLIDVSDTTVADDAFDDLDRTAGTDLFYLDLSSTQITSHSLRAISRFRSLEHLDVSRTGVSDPALSLIADFIVLQYLSLSDCNITDEGVGAIACQSLQYLDLSNTSITAAAFTRLEERCPSLVECDVMNCQGISSDELAHLRRQFPNIKFYDRYIRHYAEQ